MAPDRNLIEVFFEVQRGLPRQGPGSNDSTLKAFALCSGLPENPTVLDIGSGPGMQTIALAQACSGRIIAVDTCDEYLDELRQRARQANVADRVEVANADMASLELPKNSSDLIWCEAAAYIIGVAVALETWRPLLRKRGYLAFSELVWLDENPPTSVSEFWREHYPAMTSIQAVRRKIREAGYELVGDFTLPDSDWWSDYYEPLEAKLPSLRQKYMGDEEALNVIAMTESEIEMRRRFGQSYGYEFFVARKLG